VKGYRPPASYAGSREVCELFERVACWQDERRFTPDGLLGPTTWAARDEELEALAAKVHGALVRAGLQETYVGRFLARVLMVETEGCDVTNVPRLEATR